MRSAKAEVRVIVRLARPFLLFSSHTKKGLPVGRPFLSPHLLPYSVIL